jgi:uncharacterized protein DUF1206
MRERDRVLSSLKTEAQRLTYTARTWVALLARFGYATKGSVYMIIGLLAALAAFNRGGRTTDSQGAFQEILSQPYGQFLLGTVAIGLVGYTVWCCVQAIQDTEHRGSSAKGIIIRLGYGVVGFIHASLALSAVQLIMGVRTSYKGEESSKEWTAVLLAQPFGQWLVGIVGVGVLIAAIMQFYQAYTGDFRQELKRSEMSDSTELWAMQIGRIGLIARGIVFAVIGIFVLLAATHANPNEARGLRGALRVLEQQPLGPWVLGLIALGLMAYGIYMLVLACYRRIGV